MNDKNKNAIIIILVIALIVVVAFSSVMACMYYMQKNQNSTINLENDNRNASINEALNTPSPTATPNKIEEVEENKDIVDLDVKYAVWCSDKYNSGNYFKNGEGLLEFVTERPLDDYGLPNAKFISYVHYSESEIVFKLSNTGNVAIKNPIARFEFNDVFLIPHINGDEYIYSNFVNGMGFYTNIEWQVPGGTIQPGIEKEFRLNMKECPILSDNASVKITVAADNYPAKTFTVPVKARDNNISQNSNDSNYINLTEGDWSKIDVESIIGNNTD